MSTPSQPQPQTQARERAPTAARLDLTLFVSGGSPVSARAEARLREICDRHCPSGYALTVVDIYLEPEVVVTRGVLAVPTLIKERPTPVRVLIGDFSDEPRVLSALGLSLTKKSEPQGPRRVREPRE